MKNFLTGMRMMTIMHNVKDFKRGKRIDITLVIAIQFRKDDEGNMIYSS